jgi:hypothetical protein
MEDINGKMFSELVNNFEPGDNIASEISFECPEGQQGCDIGCCANYDGDCIYCDTACLIHDLDCIDCEPYLYCGGPFCSFESCEEGLYQ